jgi:hypothetical protein
MDTDQKKKKRYVQVHNDPAYRRALKLAAAEEGLTVSDYVERLIMAARPDIEALAKRFERM